MRQKPNSMDSFDSYKGSFVSNHAHHHALKECLQRSGRTVNLIPRFWAVLISTKSASAPSVSGTFPGPAELFTSSRSALRSTTWFPAPAQHCAQILTISLHYSKASHWQLRFQKDSAGTVLGNPLRDVFPFSRPNSNSQSMESRYLFI